MIEEGLKAYLGTVAGVTTLVSTRIYPMHLPQVPTLSALTYTRIFGAKELSHSGPSGLAQTQFQIDCWASSYSGAKALSEQVRIALDGYSGVMGTSTVCAVEWMDDMDDFDEESDCYRVICSVKIWHRE